MRSAAIAVLAFACTAGASAQDLQRLLPGRTAPGESTEDFSWDNGPPTPVEPGALLMESLNGIDLIGDLVTTPAATAPVQFNGLIVPNGRKLTAELSSYLSLPVHEGSLVAIMDTIVAHYQRAGLPVVEVLLPEQEITSGRITVAVIEGTVGEVAREGGLYLRALPLSIQSGDRLTMAALQGELDWLNRNPFHRALLEVAPGTELAQADLLFRLSDERPLRLFAGFDNAGVAVVGEHRWRGGVDWGNAFGLGHRLVYQATVGTDAEAFRAHALDYRIPLPWRHELSFQGAVARSSVALEDGFVSDGNSYLAAAMYRIPLRRRGSWRQEIGIGAEFKSTDNNLEFGGAEVFDTAVESLHFVGRYTARSNGARGGTALVGDVLFSPGDLTADNSDAAFAGIRAAADSQYTVLRLSGSHRRDLPAGMALLLRGGGQWSDAPLLPSEQLALGGHDRVRGYQERSGLADIGYWGSAELRSPRRELNIFNDPQLQVLGFVDYGSSWQQDSGHRGDNGLSSAGVGARFTLPGRAVLRFDYGWALDGGGGRAHFGVTAPFGAAVDF